MPGNKKNVELSPEEELLIKNRREEQERKKALTRLSDALESMEQAAKTRFEEMRKAHEEELAVMLLRELERASEIGKVPEHEITQLFNASFGAGTAALLLPQLSKFPLLAALIAGTTKERERVDAQALCDRRERYARDLRESEDRARGARERAKDPPIDYTR